MLTHDCPNPVPIGISVALEETYVGPQWSLWQADDEYFIPINYCPWCGQALIVNLDSDECETIRERWNYLP